MTQEKGLDLVGGIARRLPGELFRRTRLVLLGGKGKGGTTVSGVEGFDAGFVEEIHEAVSGLDVLWHPARSEGLGTSVIDAMALGVPPIAFAVGGLPEVIEDGKSGLLVPAGDADRFRTRRRRIDQRRRPSRDACRRSQTAGPRVRRASHDPTDD